MFIAMVIVFVLGYIAIALEHPLKVDKAVPALAIGTLMWVLYCIGAEEIFNGGFSVAWNEFIHGHGDHGSTVEAMRHFISHNEILHHLGETSEILFFLLGAMTIVEVIDKHDGFKVITDRIATTKKVKLLWILSFLTFFMSAALDNLTTTIVMVALLRKLISDKQTKWFFASMIVLAANAGGAWSPIGDVTTIMLWIGGQVEAGSIIANVILPSMITMIVPLAILSFTMKGNVNRPEIDANAVSFARPNESILMLILGVSGLLFVPVFKTVFHLPPFQGMLLSLSVIWLVSELMHAKKPSQVKKQLKVIHIIKHVEIPTIFFFLGILMAVAAMQSAGQLHQLSVYLGQTFGTVTADGTIVFDEKGVVIIDLIIGVLSAIVDNVPLVAGAMGMYDIGEGFFAVNGLFWEFLAYTAGTGGSILIIGSAAGVAAMGMEKIDFIWYLKKISWLALIGYLAGAGVYFLQAQFIHH